MRFLCPVAFDVVGLNWRFAVAKPPYELLMSFGKRSKKPANAGLFTLILGWFFLITCIRLTGQLQYPYLMLKGNVVELMRRNTAVAYCALCIATYRVGLTGYPLAGRNKPTQAKRGVALPAFLFQSQKFKLERLGAMCRKRQF